MTRSWEIKDKSFILRFDADKRVGMGHFNRCYALGEALRKQGFDLLFVCRRVEEGVGDLLRRKGSKYCIIPEEVTWAKEPDYIFDKCAGGNSIVVLDISTPYAFEDMQGILSYINMLRERCPIVLIDGMRDNALLTKINAQVDVAIVPYFGTEGMGLNPPNARIYLAGPQYFIFSPEYESSGTVKREIRSVAEKVLVTLGGADPCGVTIKVLNAIEGIKNRKISARVIIGPNFDSSLGEKIKNLADTSMHIRDIVYSPSSLLEHMLWCDIAVTSSGLTKYEMALTGTPSLQISFSYDYAVVNEPFTRYGSAKHLGVHDTVYSEHISKEIVKLLDNEQERRSMSEAGQSLLDARGTLRIIEAIRRAI
jgi:spore coat polysaccharide biosynthesis predicted glycosyltransferase SpsG